MTDDHTELVFQRVLATSVDVTFRLDHPVHLISQVTVLFQPAGDIEVWCRALRVVPGDGDGPGFDVRGVFVDNEDGCIGRFVDHYDGTELAFESMMVRAAVARLNSYVAAARRELAARSLIDESKDAT